MFHGRTMGWRRWSVVAVVATLGVAAPGRGQDPPGCFRTGLFITVGRPVAHVNVVHGDLVPYTVTVGVTKLADECNLRIGRAWQMKSR